MKTNKELKIAPSVLSADFGYLADEVKRIEPFCKFLHLDVMDAHYVPNLSIGTPVIKTLRKHTDMVFDTHLMITNPEDYVKVFADCGSDYITFHIECSDDVPGLIDKIHGIGKKAGISIHPDTPIDEIYPYLGLVDLVLIMSVRPGFGGQRFMPDACMRIDKVRRKLNEINSDAILSVDGGINAGTIKLARSCGVDLFVSGSSVFCAPDSAKAVEEMIRCGSQL